ncbi:hypothetical protein CBOM_07445 [Ceraceosorus bombacis]|uniref:Uncharacterized protein n=1 Tax=Ceraceosorus bombacis TaxID=401625 RepID=A0A0P1BDV9_9BASI|nr:hypothetical protein CBOM_07445 [Ceraceosorus bombacis]
MRAGQGPGDTSQPITASVTVKSRAACSLDWLSYSAGHSFMRDAHYKRIKHSDLQHLVDRHALEQRQWRRLDSKCLSSSCGAEQHSSIVWQ